jgi:hypothetical protein
MTVRKTVLGVTNRNGDFAMIFKPPRKSSVHMMALLGTVLIHVNYRRGT